jgi:tetratricopeptide (TPR) repeat protein
MDPGTTGNGRLLIGNGGKGSEMLDSGRARWSFGRLLDWHFIHGTRRGNAGERWTTKTFADAVGLGDRAVRYWLRDEHLPQDTLTIEDRLFGSDFSSCTVWRFELREALARSRAAGRNGDAPAPADGPVAPQAPAAPPLPVSNIPIRVPAHFMGRDDALAAIAAAFGSGDGRLAVAITALHGLRGVGKSTLAAAYAERHRRDYRLAWWIGAHEEASLHAGLVGLGIRLGWVDKDQKEEPALTSVMERMRHDGDGLLLIYDNATGADALVRWLPRGGGARVIVTSNDHAWRGVAAPVAIDVWSADTGANFLIARAGRSTAERADAVALSQALGGLPLAREQAAAWCERRSTSFAAYLKRFEATPARFLDDARHAPADYGRTVAKTFAVAIDEAARLHPAAEPLIVHAAMLAPDPIPLFLFAEAHDKFDEPLRTALAYDGLDEAVAALRAFALVDRETIADERDAAVTTDAIRLHRLVRKVAAQRGGGQAEPMRQVLAAALAAVYPDDACDNPASWRRCAPLTPHLLSICRVETADDAANVRCADLLDRAGSYFYRRAAYVEARPLFERSLAIREKTLGPEHPDTAKGLNGLAVLLVDQFDFVGARQLVERALAINENVQGPEHPDTTTNLDNLAFLLQAQGDLVGGRLLYERALTIREKVLGPEHPDTATSLNTLAFLLENQGDLVGARLLYERALTIREKVLGPEHPDTATSLSTLAFLLENQGDLVGARQLVERALTINENVQGPAHPDTTTNLNHLAFLLQSQGDLVGARLLYERALSIREEVLGPEHPDTAASVNMLAFLLQSQGDLAGARLLYERALSIREKVLGPEHPRTANTLNNLARVLSQTGDTDDAKALFKRAIAIGEKALGGKHFLTQRFCSCYARHVLDTGRPAEALPLAEAALATHEASVGLNHPWTKDSARVAADVLDALNRHVEATALRARHGISPESPQLVFLRGLGVARSRFAHRRHVISIFNV